MINIIWKKIKSKKRIIQSALALVLALVLVVVVSVKEGWVEWDYEDGVVRLYIKPGKTSNEPPKIISDYAAAIILMTKDGSKLPTINKVSDEGVRFFGWWDSDDLIGKDMDSILNRLRDYMDEQDYMELYADQHRLIEKYKKGEPLHFQKAIRFNDKHPFHEYANMAFGPVVVDRWSGPKNESGEAEQEYLYILYIDEKIARDLSKAGEEFGP